jgi:hypothetical protein
MFIRLEGRSDANTLEIPANGGGAFTVKSIVGKAILANGYTVDYQLNLTEQLWIEVGRNH